MGSKIWKTKLLLAPSAGGQDEVNPVFGLATRASKLATEDVCPTRKKFSWPYDKSFIDQACLVEMTGY